VSISIYDISGKLFLLTTYPDVQGHFEKTYDISGYPSGEFLLKIGKGNSNETGKFIKR
jgi:hypothetical protein